MYTQNKALQSLIGLVIFLLCSLTSTIAQGQEKQQFPEDWVGLWKGTLEIFDGNGLKQSLPMELHIQPRDSQDHYDWWIIYGEDKEAGKRAYQLKPKDKSKGEWVVDEQNTILLECYFFQDKLWSWYDVMNNLIMVSNEVHGDEMIFEIIAGKTEPVSITGNQKFDGNDIPEVKTFPVGAMQRAKLIRKHKMD